MNLAESLAKVGRRHSNLHPGTLPFIPKAMKILIKDVCTIENSQSPKYNNNSTYTSNLTPRSPYFKLNPSAASFYPDHIMNAYTCCNNNRFHNIGEKCKVTTAYALLLINLFTIVMAVELYSLARG